MENLGPTDIFSGPMAGPITRPVKCIKIIANATFTVLIFTNSAGSAGAAAPAGVANYPSLLELEYIKSFQLATGVIQVVYYF